jgi:hypothetical protein
MKNKTYKALIQQRTRQINQLKEWVARSFIRGSIRIQGNRCGKKGCRCKREENPVYHGPYSYLSYRGKTTNHSIFLTKNKMRPTEEAIDNYRKLMDVIIELSETNFRILRYHSDKLKGGNY